MTVQLIITGDHATDLAAELKMLAEALFPSQEPPFEPDHSVGMARAKELAHLGMIAAANEPEQGAVTGVLEPILEKSKRAPRKKKEIAEDIATVMGGKLVNNEIVVEDPLSVNTPVETTEDKILDHQALKDLINTVGKNTDGTTDSVKYAKIFKVMQTFVGGGQEVKIINIPADKIKEVYYSIAAI